MTELVQFPDMAQILSTRIGTATGEPTGTRVPNPRTTGGFVLVRRIGGPRLNIVTDKPTVTIEAWHDTDAQAHDLIQLARSIVYAMRGEQHSGSTIYAVDEFAGPVDFPDPLSDQPRYTCTFSIGVRGVALEITS